jgi:hypothetical protein
LHHPIDVRGAETLTDPKLHIFPIKEVANIGRRLGMPLVVDNTAAPCSRGIELFFWDGSIDLPICASGRFTGVICPP